jgi:hypothetical protein
MYNLDNNTKISDALYTVLCVVRLFTFLPLILICFCFVPLMYLLGISDPLGKWVKLNEDIVFNVKD